MTTKRSFAPASESVRHSAMDDKLLQAALHLARIGAHVLPLWWPTAQGCACGNPMCQSPGKHPIASLVPHGVKNATNDPATITEYWSRYPYANIGVACGRISGIVVGDVDGPKGWEALQWVLSLHNATLASEWFVETGREGGRHFYFAYPDHGVVPTHKIDGLELRSDGAYVVAPPSLHASGKIYQWRHVTKALPELPSALLDFALRKLKPPEPQAAIATKSGVNAAILAPDTARAPPAWSEAEEAKILDWLACIPADDRDTWLKVGAGLHWAGWGARAREIWDAWSKSSSKYNAADQQKAWESFSRPYPGTKVTLGTIRYLADMHGYKSPVDDAVGKVNERFFMLRNMGGKCLIGELVPNNLGTGKSLSLTTPDNFKTWFSNQHMKVGDKLYPLGAAWVLSKQRRQYETVILDPAVPEVTENNSLNLWRGFGVDPKSGNWHSIQDHIFHVLADNDWKAYEYILRWTAWSIQNPGRMPEVALVFRGGKGAGKGFFANTVARLFGEHALHIFSQSHLTGNFNGHLRSCLLLYVDEAFWAGDKKGESVLKGLITENVLMIEQKGIDAAQWKNRLHIIMTANSQWVVPASADERRFAVFNANDYYVKRPKERVPYFNHLYYEAGNGGLPAMLYDLKNWKLGDWHPRQVYETAALFEQKRHSMTPVEQWFDNLLEEGTLPGYKIPGAPHFPTSQALLEDFQKRAPSGARYTAGGKLLGDFLRELDCVPQRVKGFRAWHMRPLSQLRHVWMERYGSRDWDIKEDWG